MMELSRKAMAHSSRERVETEETEVVPIPIGWTRTYSGVGHPYVGSRVVVGEMDRGFRQEQKNSRFQPCSLLQAWNFVKCPIEETHGDVLCPARHCVFSPTRTDNNYWTDSGQDQMEQGLEVR